MDKIFAVSLDSLKFPFTTNQTELDYYHQNDLILKKLENIGKIYVKVPFCHRNLKKISEILGIDGEYPAGHPQ